MVSTTADKVSGFLESPLLSGMDVEARRAISRKIEETEASKGSALLSQGEPNDRLWFVTEGNVALERRQANGQVEILANLAGPAIFGTTTFFRSSAPSTSLRATTDLKVWTLDRQGYEALRREEPRAAEALALAVVLVLSERFDLLDVRISELMADHGGDHSGSSELATFRARLFEDPAL